MAPHSEQDMNGASLNGSVQATTHTPNTTITPQQTSDNHRNKSAHLHASDVESVHDLVCVGFGPASLAIAVALNDALETGRPTLTTARPNVLFLEKQPHFAWHAGMLLAGAKMQISFMKDMASLRNPRSHFTFLNYVHTQNRLLDFINLDTFLPARTEYEAYLRWCASHFDDVVRYNSEVVSVSPGETDAASGGVKVFTVVERNAKTGATSTHRARNVVLAVGGQASIPKPLPAKSPRVIHSSQYAYMLPQILKDRNAPVKVAVIGAGQSAAEIFHNVSNLYPNSKTYLVMKQEFIKPSDDSPFVNCIFNPEFTDHIYNKPAAYRQNLIKDAKATNYGVVRLGLIETLFEMMYDQKRTIGHDETQWPHRILGGRKIVGVDEHHSGDHSTATLRVRPALPGVDIKLAAEGLVTESECSSASEEYDDVEELEVDLIVAATGYKRTAHLDILKDAWSLLPEQAQEGVSQARADRWAVETEAGSRRVMEVGRDYKVKFNKGVVAPDSGIWLQGCCEGTHGLSDTLLSVVSVRAGETVEAIFGKSA